MLFGVYGTDADSGSARFDPQPHPQSGNTNLQMQVGGAERSWTVRIEETGWLNSVRNLLMVCARFYARMRVD